MKEPLAEKKRPPVHQWLRRLPNHLTVARIATIPVLLLLHPLDFIAIKVFAAVLFALASLTDFLDGYLARKYQSITPLGTLLDPIADKMLVAAGLVLLAYSKTVPPLFAAILICRDIGISGMRLVALERKIHIQVSEFGKWKTAVLDIAIFCLLINKPLFNLPFRQVGMAALWISLALSLYSAWKYVQGYWQTIKEEQIS